MLEQLYIEMEKEVNIHSQKIKELGLGEKENPEYIRNTIYANYIVKSNEQNIFIENHWKNFNKEVERYENLIKKYFGKAIEKVDLKGAKILEYRAKYDPESEESYIEVTKLSLPSKRHTLESIFASIDDSRLSPEIFEFRNKYDICSISYKIDGIEYEEEKK
jgi:hypothetical protein